MPSDESFLSESKLYEEIVERVCASIKKSLDNEEEDMALNTSDYLSSEYETDDEIKVRKRLTQRAG